MRAMLRRLLLAIPTAYPEAVTRRFPRPRAASCETAAFVGPAFGRRAAGRCRAWPSVPGSTSGPGGQCSSPGWIADPGRRAGASTAASRSTRTGRCCRPRSS